MGIDSMTNRFFFIENYVNILKTRFYLIDRVFNVKKHGCACFLLI